MKVVTFGEIMLRLATPGYLRFNQTDSLKATFGGGEANVAVSLSNYGIPVDFVTRLPENDIARACVSDLRRFGVGVDQIIYGGERIGIYFLETGAVNRGSKVVYDRANSAVSEIPNCGAAVVVGNSGICSFCSGKLTTGTFDWLLSRIQQDESYRG